MKVRNNKYIIIFRSGLIGDTIVAIPALFQIKKIDHSNLIIYISLIEKKEHILPELILRDLNLVNRFFVLRIYNLFYFIKDLFVLSYFLFTKRCIKILHLETQEFNFKLKKIYFSLFGIHKFFYEKNYTNEKISNRLIAIVNQAYDLPIFFNFDEPINLNFKNPITRNLNNASAIVKDKKIVIFGACTNFKSKLWDKQNFIFLANELKKQHNFYPVFYGSISDFRYCEDIISELGFGFNFAGKFSLIESLFFFKYAQFYIGNDTGVMHMASVMNKKCFTIFSAIENDIKWFPYGIGHINFKILTHCSGCKLKICISYNNMCTVLIKKEYVLEKILYNLEN